MDRLILMRHGKAERDSKSGEDFDRKLTDRGVRESAAMAANLADLGLVPDIALVSAAQRTRETWDRVAGAVLETRPEVRYLDALYHAAPDVMLAHLRHATQPTVMMIGHNPGIAEFAARLPARPVFDPDFRKFPTCATLIIDFQIDDWSEVKPGFGSMLDFFPPSNRGT